MDRGELFPQDYLLGKGLMSKHAVSIGEGIRARRSQLGLSQRDLARAAGTTAAAVSHIERGARNLSASLLVRIAGALQCSPGDLLAGAAATTEPAPYLGQVTAAMMGFTPVLQKEVADFCEYLRHRRGRRGK